MKQLIAGGIGMLSGVMLLGFTLVAAAVYAPHMAMYGYTERYGLYGSALLDIGIAPLIFSAVLMLSGLVFLYQAIDRDWKARYFLIGGEAEAAAPKEGEGESR